MLAIGIDIGTTHTKAAAIDEDGTVWSAESSAYRLRFTEDGGVEQRPEEWWDALCEAMHGLWSQGVNPQDIGCIALSGHGCSLVVIDAEGQLLMPAVSSLDARCSPQAEAIRESAAAVILERNGNAVGAFNFDPKLRWLKETRPALYEKTDVFLSAAGYCAFRLTGERALNDSDGGIAMAYDRRTGGRWDETAIAAMGLDRAKYPRLIACGAILGEVLPAAAAATGLRPGTLVLGGGEDTSSAAFAAGVTRAGTAYLSLGTQGTVGVCTDRFAVRPELLGFPHVLPGLHLLSGSMSTFGAGLRWFADAWCRDLSGEAERDPEGGGLWDRIMSACEKSEAGARGLLFLPYLSGELHPVLDERAAGIYFGLKLSHTREDMARALLEGTAHAVRHNLSFAEAASGPTTRLRATGGPTRSPLWCQTIADVTQRVIEVTGGAGGGGAPLGNALLAMGHMRRTDPAPLAEAAVTVVRTHEPSPASRAIHDRHHEVYRSLYERTKELFPLLAASPQPSMEEGRTRST